MTTTANAPAITSFRGEHAFLSNFHERTFAFAGELWPSAEHAFQAFKTLDPLARIEIAEAATPGQAKRLGRRAELRSDWEIAKRSVMQQVLVAKFSLPDLRAALLATGDARLVEGNTWGDTYWGVCRGEGRNELGKLLMRIREHIATYDPLPAWAPNDDVVREANVDWLKGQCHRATSGYCTRPACMQRAGGHPEHLAHPLQQPTCNAWEILQRIGPRLPEENAR